MGKAIRSYLVKRINEEYSKFVGRAAILREEGTETLKRENIGFIERVRIVLENNLLQWALLREKT